MIILLILAWLAPALQLYILLHNVPGNGLTYLQAAGRFLLFFTILTNLLVAISITSILLAPQSKWGQFFSKPTTLTAVALYIFIVGLVYNIILRNIWEPVGLQKWVDEALHVLVPLLFIFFWLFFVPKGNLKWRHAFSWLIYPALYLIYAVLRGATEGFYPYPFIDAGQLGYNRVLINATGLLLVFIIAGFLFIGIDQLKRPALKPV
ncbi:Pr6Pr family membrane protein [Terrimonas pollutisoli]|uniref:Pr6Pr family membrane protein n=1 Tax=Terrimonas pollutisoli TaxID=3034147 RepID=UPI0023EC6BAD|nr:Pr6Pr family membrane protein [Terrimonas sp. H1YJ31]